MTQNETSPAPYRAVKPRTLYYLGIATLVSEWRKAGPSGLRVMQYQQGDHVWATVCTGDGRRGTFQALATAGAQQGESTTIERVQELVRQYLA